MTAQLHVVADSVIEIPLQEASLDIWDTKYRLKSKDGKAIETFVEKGFNEYLDKKFTFTKGNALQWRLQYKRVIDKAGDIEGIVRVI